MINRDEDRDRLLFHHAALRVLIADLEGCAAGVLAGRRESAQQMRVRLAALQEAFTIHLDHEERTLAPILGTIDAWGPQRLETLREEHAHQRAVLQDLRERSRVDDSAELAEDVLEAARELLTDMQAEERDLLDPDVLRDGCITTDVGDD